MGYFKCVPLPAAYCSIEANFFAYGERCVHCWHCVWRNSLDDNMIIQKIAFFLTFICWGIWIAASLDSPAFQEGTWHIPAINTDAKTGSQAAVLGTILFNFGFVTTVPSWVNEKKPHVSVNKTVWISTFCCNLVFFAIGAQSQLDCPCTDSSSHCALIRLLRHCRVHGFPTLPLWTCDEQLRGVLCS